MNILIIIVFSLTVNGDVRVENTIETEVPDCAIANKQLTKMQAQSMIEGSDLRVIWRCDRKFKF